jgi:hypothetical protein
MRVRLGAALLAFATAGLLASGPAFGADFTVAGTADSVGGACGPADANGLRPCPSLRAAVSAANASADAEDNVILTLAGIYALSNGELLLQDGVSLFGVGARSVRIQSATSRVLHVLTGAEVTVSGVTIAGGSVTGNGGNILNEGFLQVFQARVTGGVATSGSGGGIANAAGDLSVIESLIDGNHADFSGGGIDNTGGSSPAHLDVSDSTIASNDGSTGSGIATGGNASNSVALSHVTFNFNIPAISISTTGQTVTTVGSIFTTNVASNPLCNGVGTPTDLGYNIDRGNSCLFTGTGSLINTDPAISSGLVNRGGGTDLFSIETSSPAAGLVASCGSGLDQRGYRRSPTFLEPCDAGSYEIDGQPIVPDPPVQPPPPPVPPVVTPTPTPAPSPTPVAGQSVAAETVKGKVLVKLPGSNKFVPLDESVIKNGAEIDTRKGTVEITRSDGGAAKFFDGIFKLSQPGGVTTVTLSEKLDCKKSGGKANAAAKKPKSRKLWGDGAGKFRTRGQYSAATIRGTKWLVTDTCTTTTTKVTQGTVAVQDLVKKKTVVVRKGKSYTARSKR